MRNNFFKEKQGEKENSPGFFFATVRQIRKVVSIVLVSGTSRIINMTLVTNSSAFFSVSFC